MTKDKNKKIGVFSAFYNNKTNNIYVGTQNGDLILLDSNLNFLQKVKISNGIIGLTLSSKNGEFVCSTSDEGNMFFWKSNDSLTKQYKKINASNLPIYTGIISDNHKYFFCTGKDSCIRLYDFKSFNLLRIDSSGAEIRFAWMSNNEEQLLWINNNGFLFSANLNNKNDSIIKIKISDCALSCIVLNEIENEISITDDKGNFYIIEYPSYKLKKKYLAYPEGACFIAEWNTNNSYLATTGITGEIKIWKKQNKQYVLFKSILAHDNAICSLHFDKNGNKMLSASLSGEIKEWDSKYLKLINSTNINDL